jgi:hypothetical protein
MPAREALPLNVSLIVSRRISWKSARKLGFCISLRRDCVGWTFFGGSGEKTEEKGMTDILKR